MASGRVQGLPAAEEEQVIKSRVLTQTAPVRGDPPFKKITKRFLSLVEEAEKGASAEALDKMHQALLKELSLFELQADKYDVMLLANAWEQQRYAAKQEELATQIEQAESDITGAKAELEQAKIIRQQHEEYEILRHLLVKHPSRAATQAEIDRVENAIQKMKQEGQRATAMLQRRRQQFALLFHVIEELQRTIEETGEGTADACAMDVDT